MLYVNEICTFCLCLCHNLISVSTLEHYEETYKNIQMNSCDNHVIGFPKSTVYHLEYMLSIISYGIFLSFVESYNNFYASGTFFDLCMYVTKGSNILY